MEIIWPNSFIMQMRKLRPMRIKGLAKAIQLVFLV